MWIEEKQTSKGTMYRCYERYNDPLTGKSKKACITIASNTNQSRKAATALLLEKIKTLSTDKPQKVSFDDVAAECLEYSKHTLKHGSFMIREAVTNRLIQKLPPGILLNKVTANMIQDILTDIYHKQNKSHSYAMQYKVAVSHIFRYAKRRKYINDISLLADLELRKKPKTTTETEKQRNKFLSRHELKDILSKLECVHKRVTLAMEFISLTGLRIGELMALRLQDYDKTKKEINVNGTISHTKTRSGELIRGTPKNSYSERVVRLDDRADKIIRYLILENKRAVAWKMDGYVDKGYIFTAINGDPISIQQANAALAKVCPGLTTHIFRHTHISLLAELGIPIKAIMQRVGHNDPATTLKIYTHVTASMQDDVINKLQAVTAQ